MLTELRRSVTLVGARGVHKWLLLVAGASVLSVIEAAAALLVLAVLTALVSHGATHVPLIGVVGPTGKSLPHVAKIGIAFFALRGCMNILQSYFVNRVVHNQGVVVSSELLSGYMAMPYEWHLRRDSAQSIRNAYETVTVWINQVVLPSMVMVSEFLVLAALLAILLVASPIVTLLAVGLIGMTFGVLLRLLRPRIVGYGRVIQGYSEQSLQTLQFVFEGLRDIEVSNASKWFIVRFLAARRGYANARALGATLSDVPRFLVEAFVFVVTFGFLAIHPTGSNIAVLGLFGYAAVRSLPSLNRIAVSIGQIRLGAAATSDLFSDVVLTRQHSVKLRDRGPEDVPPYGADLEVKDVSFAYEGKDRLALDRVSCSIASGEMLGVVGGSGSGKSTLLDVVAGLLVPTAGQISAGGASIYRDLRCWQAGIALVSQTTFILDESVRRNVAFGLQDENIDDERVWAALQLARLADVVRVLPFGIESIVGERGAYLSGGERQRLAIARALYREASVILLDEPTSALDQRTEAEFLGSLQHVREGRTILMAAHRFRAVERCDRVVVLQQGHVVESGTYAELLVRSSEFRNLAGSADDGNRPS